MYKNEMLDAIRVKMEKQGKNGKKLSEYILNNMEEAAYLTALKLGEKVGVSESTVIRYVMRMGYSGYPEFQEKLAQAVVEKHKSRALSDIETNSPIEQVSHYELNRLEYMYNNIDESALDNTASIIDEAKHVYVLGVKESMSVATYLADGLARTGKDVVLITCDIMDKLYRIKEGDILFVISFPEYSFSVLKAMEYANTKQVPIIALTDDASSPVSLYSACVLIAPTKRYGMIYSTTCAISLCSLILTLVMSLRLKAYEDDMALRLEASEYVYNGNDYINPVNLDFGIKDE
ncbi:MAG TPA: hypothetical protein DCX21_05275 [Eubacterium sp.]|nr:hypothetical protein [Eubacterium sp.]HBZ53522.1 hypothetical protein [Eubacterium sp.]